MRDLPVVNDQIRVRDGATIEGADMSGVWMTVTNVHVYRTPGQMSVAVTARADGTGEELFLTPDQFTVIKGVTS